ncbi:MAG: nitroreductase [Parcubacteria group bacterium LiPW_39]|nr:MAG: nitroreductase [Parcubacteria group bacterium LiPW_39]
MDQVFKKRHSTRSFKAKEIEPEKLKEILEAAHSAPSAGNLKAREIVVVKDKATKKKLAEAALGQDFIAEAAAVLVFFSVGSRSAQKYGERGKKLYALQDATISASFAWLQAVMFDLSACWVGAFDEEKVKKNLEIKEDWQPIAILPIGHA